MIRMTGKALVATWRPFEEGGQSHMRASQIASDNVTILDQIVIAQHKDGYWGTYPLANCSVVWDGKPTITYIGDDDHQTNIAITGAEHTLADSMHGRAGFTTRTKAMSSSEGAIEGALDTEFYKPAHRPIAVVEEEPEQEPEQPEEQDHP